MMAVHGSRMYLSLSRSNEMKKNRFNIAFNPLLQKNAHLTWIYSVICSRELLTVGNLLEVRGL